VRSFVPAEPVAWRWEPKAVRPRWETVLDDTLRVVPRVTTEGVVRQAGVERDAGDGSASDDTPSATRTRGR
jgi:hypothetical protein